jgi:hypothetical protein
MWTTQIHQRQCHSISRSNVKLFKEYDKGSVSIFEREFIDTLLSLTKRGFYVLNSQNPHQKIISQRGKVLTVKIPHDKLTVHN